MTPCSPNPSPAARIRVALSFAVAILALAAGCSTHRPWHNEPVTAVPPPPPAASVAGRSIVAGITLSGGGARAAAFGFGVLQALKAAAFEWGGRPTTLLDAVGFVSGVSGGSVLAAHFAAFGDAGLPDFEREFLHVDFEARVLGMALAPHRLHRLGSPWYGRTHVLAEALDALYRGRRLGDAAARPGAPELTITATDLRTGAAFEFAPDVLGRMCTDWRAVPLSFAVAASAAVPVLLSPMTLRNHAGRCGQVERTSADARGDFRSALFASEGAAYGDAALRPFVHLVDGGLADNLGLRGLLDRFVAGGAIRNGLPDAPEGSIRRMVLVVVNAERDLGTSIESSDAVPSIAQVIDSLVFGVSSRDTRITLAMLHEDARRWSEELAAERGRPGSPFAADAELHVITVGLHDVEDPALRQRLLRLPTSLSLPREDVDLLRDAGRDALRRSGAFGALMGSLGPGPRAP